MVAEIKQGSVMAVSDKEVKRREAVQKKRQERYEWEQAGKKKNKNERPDFKKYKELRAKFLSGNDLSQKEREIFTKQADLISQDLVNKTTLDDGDYYAWRTLPTSMQAEVKNRRAGNIAKKYGISDWRKFATATVPKALGLAGTIAGGVGGAAATGGIGAAGGAALGNAAGETVGELGAALINKLFPGGMPTPETSAQRDLLRAENLLDYYQPGQLPFSNNRQPGKYAQEGYDLLKQSTQRPSSLPTRSPLGRDYSSIPEWLQSSVPQLQNISAQPNAQSSGAQQGITGLWNRIYGRRR